MKLLPVALNVEGASILIVGGGKVATRKAATLRECGARITIISPTLCDELQAMQEELEYSARCFQADDCDSYNLVFACTNDRHVNAQIAAEAKVKNIWAQVADDAGGSTLHSAATIRRDEICIGISSGGGSPALAKHLKSEIEKCIGEEYALLLKLMSSRRKKMKAQIASQNDRAELWREVLAKGVLPLLREGRQNEAENLIDNLLQSNTEH